ncbi:MAG: hypothetical protein LBJ01_05390 [Tannerella sp.]|jgi:hypothetical protein|nr:hypothetical protein [Tannerella sp.]
MKRIFFRILFCGAIVLYGCRPAAPGRQVISLNGEWQVAKTGGELPVTYPSVASVPGLVDLAAPALDTVGTVYRDSSWYWHKRTFELPGNDFDIVRLKIFKARYHTKVYVNGQFAGENDYCFTPSYYDIGTFLKPGQPNEILIGIGSKAELPNDIPNGNDFEKIKYIPGIYDNVEIMLSGRPFIDNIQCAPDIVNEKLRVVAEVETDRAGGTLSYSVLERASGRKVAGGSAKADSMTSGGYAVADFIVDMKGAQLWTPESPFLYELVLNTGADEKRVRFGMRSFRFDPDRKVALLNEKPYYLRGTNICIYRFFEDPDRGALPWDGQWPVTLHERFKDMHWDMARYCIGFPPERWYDICDSIGFMVQDEFPVWGIYNFQSSRVAEEYRRWMRERWNHPSVVIWDAQNETVTPVTADAFRQVRDLDLSNRPWENGWAEPDRETDAVESHPYLFSRFLHDRNATEPEEGYRKALFGTVQRPFNDASGFSETMRKAGTFFPNPLIINEYGWIWLNRNGSTTTLTDRVYELLWNGSQLTPQERLHIYARHLAMLTEYWRAHRQAAGVLHFCGLAYSRSEEPRGQTSDHWIDIRNLTFEPEFYKYVKPAFAPVGLMIDLWEKAYVPSTTVTAPVHIVNDLATPFEGELTLELLRDGQAVTTIRRTVKAEGYAVEIIPFEITLPDGPGNYLLKAAILLDGEEVFSLRDIELIHSN